MLTIFGIKNCDTVKRARKWLSDAQIDHVFHDFRKDGLEPEMLASMLDGLGMDALVNRRGTTWRNLPDAVKETLTEEQAIDLMLENPAIIKRPVWCRDGEYRLGFAAKDHPALMEWINRS